MGGSAAHRVIDADSDTAGLAVGATAFGSSIGILPEGIAATTSAAG
jgi:hypothetical protein